MAPENDPKDQSFPIGAIVEAAMRSKGWLLPTTEEAVAELEAELLSEPVEPPESLKSPESVFEEISKPLLRRARQSVTRTTPSAKNLALAAREGGEIPPEVRELMKRDREDTEREFDRKHKKDEGI